MARTKHSGNINLIPSFQAHERLEDSKLEAVSDNNLELVNEILEDITPLISVDENVAELVGILKEPHFQVTCPCPLPQPS